MVAAEADNVYRRQKKRKKKQGDKDKPEVQERIKEAGVDEASIQKIPIQE